MLTFHNDHLIAPEFCKLMVDTIDPTWDLNVIFFANTPKFGKRSYSIKGQCNADKRRVILFLQGIYYGCRSEFEIWKRLLRVAYHEFGHYANRYRFADMTIAEYKTCGRGWKACEKAADYWAYRKMLELAEHDKRICQPKRLGPYLDARYVQRRQSILARQKATSCHPNPDLLKNYRCYKSGGQQSISDVIFAIGAYVVRDNRAILQYKLIHKLADDLGYPYIDSAGRVHMFFAWGDIPEIRRRYERHKAIHETPKVDEQYLPF